MELLQRWWLKWWWWLLLFVCCLISPLLKWPHTFTAGSAASHITSSPAPNITVPPTLNFINTSLSTERGAVPTDTDPNETAPLQETRRETSTIRSLHTQTEGGRFNSHIEEVTKSQSGNSSSGSYEDVVTTVHANVTDLSVHTHEHFNSTRGNQDQRQQKKLKWIWWNIFKIKVSTDTALPSL